MSPRTQPPGGDRGRSVEVEWTTISYRTIAIYLVLAFLLVLGILYLISPKFVVNTATRVLESVAANPSIPQTIDEPEGSALREFGWQRARQEGRLVAVDAG